MFFGSPNAIGETVTVGGKPFTVVGVTHDDHTIRRFYDYTAYPDTDTMYVPLGALEQVQAYPLTYIPWSRQNGSYESFIASETAFLHAFVLLPDDPASATIKRISTTMYAGNAMPDASLNWRAPSCVHCSVGSM